MPGGTVPPYVNLADIYRAHIRNRDGEKVLREGLAAADDAALHQDAQAYARQLFHQVEAGG